MQFQYYYCYFHWFFSMLLCRRLSGSCLFVYQVTTQTPLRKSAQTPWCDKHACYVTHICGVLGPPPCGDHYVLGSQDRLLERRGKHEVTAFVHILQKTRKHPMRASGLCSILHGGDDRKISPKWVTALSLWTEFILIHKYTVWLSGDREIHGQCIKMHIS